MNTRKLLYGIVAFFVLFAAACTSNSAEDDQLYEVGVDKRKIRIEKESVDKRKIRIEKESVDKRKIRIEKES